MTGICKLCKKEKNLINRSHIIPDFFYKESGLFSESHRLRKLKSDEINRTEKHSSLPTGEYEGGILCKTCDNEILGSYEDYARKVLYGGLSKKNEVIFSKVESGIKIEVLDYTKFKLFLLSILWRAAISNRDMFEDITIEENNLEKIRVMLLNGDAGRRSTFPIHIWTYWHDKNIPRDLILQPSKSKNYRICMYTFLIGGLLINFFTKGIFLNGVAKYSISQKGEMIFRFMPGGADGMNFIKKYGKIIV